MSTTQHPLAETDAAEITDDMEEAAAKAYWSETETIMDWDDCEPYMHRLQRRGARAALFAALAVATPADPRRWRECRFEEIQQGERVRWALPENDHGTFEMTEGVAHEMRKHKRDREWVDAGGCTVACAPAHGTDGFRYWRLAGHENTVTTPAVDNRPWEPLSKGDPLNVGDEVRQEWYGVTRSGIVASVDGSGDPWTAEGGYIGPILGGTWYARRSVQELPEWTGAIIEGVDGGRIQATAEGVTYTAAEAIYRDGMWYGAWRTARGGTGIQFSSSSITPGTWKVADQ